MNTTTRSRTVRCAAAVAFALLAAACSGDADAATTTVEISGNAYQPGNVEIAAGDSVTWTNNDSVPHTVTFTGGDVAGSDELAEGETFTATFSEPGTYSYVCTLHPGMEATVTVTG